MTIEFQCVCGEALQAGDEYAGRTRMCPVCHRAITIPEITSTPRASIESQKIDEDTNQKERHQDTPLKEGFSQEGERKEPKGAMGEERQGREDESQGQERAWFRSPRFLGLAGALVVLIVAITVFTLVKGKDKAPEGIHEEVTPPAEEYKDTIVPPSRPTLKEETNQVQETLPKEGLAIGGESPEAVVVETPLIEERETGQEVTPVEEKAAHQVVSLEKKPDPIEELAPLVGSYTINVASFRQKDRAEQLVDELKREGLRAFRWEIDLPEKGKWHRVSIGNFPKRRDAEDFVAQKKLKDRFELFITRITGA